MWDRFGDGSGEIGWVGWGRLIGSRHWRAGLCWGIGVLVIRNI